MAESICLELPGLARCKLDFELAFPLPKPCFDRSNSCFTRFAIPAIVLNPAEFGTLICLKRKRVSIGVYHDNAALQVLV